MTGCQLHPFGRLPDGRDVHRIELTNGQGLQASVLTYGGILQSLMVPDRQGYLANVVPGFNSLDSYLTDQAYLGCIVGRYANRIAGGRFTLDGKTYSLDVNNGPNTLHGGRGGLHQALWQIETSGPDASVTLALTSPDGDQGFPGSVTIRATYALRDDNVLTLALEARSDAATIISLAPHAYWNLAGAGRGDITHHMIRVAADRFLPVDATQIPTGEMRHVEGSVFDLRHWRRLGDCIADMHDQQVVAAGGLDHNFIIHPERRAQMKAVAALFDPSSGRLMVVSSEAPGLQIYSGNYLSPRWSAIAFEPQHFPDAPNQPAFPSATLRPGETYISNTQFAFSLADGLGQND